MPFAIERSIVPSKQNVSRARSRERAEVTVVSITLFGRKCTLHGGSVSSLIVSSMRNFGVLPLPPPPLPLSVLLFEAWNRFYVVPSFELSWSDCAFNRTNGVPSKGNRSEKVDGKIAATAWEAVDKPNPKWIDRKLRGYTERATRATDKNGQYRFSVERKLEIFFRFS